MNTVLCVGLLICVALAYATALPSPAQEAAENVFVEKDLETQESRGWGGGGWGRGGGGWGYGGGGSWGYGGGFGRGGGGWGGGGWGGRGGFGGGYGRGGWGR